MTSAELIDLLRTARESAGLSQRQLSTLMGYSTAWVGRVETGRMGIQVDDISKWAELCGLELSLELRAPRSDPSELSTPELLQEAWVHMDDRDRRLMAGMVTHLLNDLKEREARKSIQSSG